MADKIRVLIVDDLPETRENVRKLLQFEPDLDVIGQAGNGHEAIDMAKQHRPDVVLMDINMPGVDGIGASQQITKSVPEAQVIIMSVQSEADYLRKAMLAGARDFLMKPFSGDELVAAIRRVYETRPVIAAPQPVYQQQMGQQGLSRGPVRQGKVLVAYSPKGGIGCTTVAVNLAVALAEQGHNTLLVDGSLQFGDVGVMLNVKSPTTIIDIIERIDELDPELISSVVSSTHSSGLNVLLAPARPEEAELVNDTHMKELFKVFRTIYDFIVVDTSSSLNDVTLAVLDLADRVILIARQNLPTLKNVSRFFDLSEELDYEAGKVALVVNHASNRLNITVKNIGDTLRRPVVAVIPEEDGAYDAADQGVALVSGPLSRRPAAVALNKFAVQLSEELQEGKEEDSPAKESKSGSRLSRLFGSR